MHRSLNTDNIVEGVIRELELRRIHLQEAALWSIPSTYLELLLGYIYARYTLRPIVRQQITSRSPLAASNIQDRPLFRWNEIEQLFHQVLTSFAMPCSVRIPVSKVPEITLFVEAKKIEV